MSRRTGNMDQQSKLSDHGFSASDAKRNKFPLQATCLSCGRVRWLNWVVKGSHVCNECKNFLVKKKSG